MTTMFSVPATPISDEMAALQPAFEAFVSAAGLQKDYGYSFYRELPQDGYTVVLASLDRLSASLLFQFDLLVNQAFPAPDYQPGIVVKRFLDDRIVLVAMAVVNDFVLAISTIGLRSTRAGGMGMNDKTRDAVFEIGTMYTRPEFRYRGISTTLSTIRLTVGIDTIIELAKSAIESGNGPKLERRLDKQIAEDLGGFNAERFLAALLSDDAIIRVFFENVKDQMPRVMKLATSLGFQQTAASTMLVERVLGDMVAVQEDADSPASLYLGQVYPKDGVGNDSHVQYLFKGSDSFARALRIATIIAERSGAEKSFEEGTEIVWDNNSPERIVYPADAGEVLVDLSNLSEEEASDRAKEIPGNVVVKMPAVKSSTVAWGLHRQK